MCRLGQMVTIMLAAASALVGSTYAGSIRYVDDDASLGGDGVTWETAYRHLQDALADVPGGGVSEIRAAQGAYMPDRDEGGNVVAGDREATFQLLTGVTIRGGYAGFGAPDPDARDIELFETILSGDLLGDDIDDFGNYEENSFHVVTSDSVDETAVLEGVTLTAGNTQGAELDGGGGMLNGQFSSPTVTQCLFRANSASGEEPFDGDGAGMYNDYGSSPIVTLCEFNGNVASGGGGAMYNYRTAAPCVTECVFVANTAAQGAGLHNYGGAPVVSDCVFTDNEAGFSGAGMWSLVIEFDEGSPTVENCAFSANSAMIEAGAMYFNSAHSTVSNCTFDDNSAGENAGAMLINGGHPIVTDCVFHHNTADDRGGAVFTYATSMEMYDCIFNANTSEFEGGGVYTSGFAGAIPTFSRCTFDGNSAGTLGGGMYNFAESHAIVTECSFIGNSAGIAGGGMHNNTKAVPTVTACTFSGNSAVIDGGGMYNLGSTPAVINCVFIGNTATNFGGGIMNDESNTIITNCTIVGNTNNLLGGGVANVSSSDSVVTNCVVWGNAPDQIFSGASSPTVTYCNVAGGHEGEGNIAIDPMFVDPEDGNYHLASGSPCIDSADSTEPWLDTVSTDLDGSPRFVDDPNTPDTGIPDESNVVVDMGVYEFQIDVCLADLSGDGVVGPGDLAIILGNWGPVPPGDPIADLNNDNTIGPADLAIVLGNWGPCP